MAVGYPESFANIMSAHDAPNAPTEQLSQATQRALPIRASRIRVKLATEERVVQEPNPARTTTVAAALTRERVVAVRSSASAFCDKGAQRAE
ncbi:hypothetical protein C369_07373 [Cryptococcus neoformans A5-35-17]|nr:hypothetical protein C369_07373 [Cryptococcus neoformans var. grubii A5-35-17]